MKRTEPASCLESLKKKMKATTDGEGIISDLNSDVWSHVIEYLQIGEVIMLSLVNQSIHQIISDHIRIIHPYCLEDEWSISRALLNHRSVPITNDTIERVQHIVQQLIEKNEPLTKFTKRFVLEDWELTFDQVFKLLSTTSANQSVSNKDTETLENIPTGFGLEQLEVSYMKSMTTSELFKLLSQCPNITHLEVNNVEYDGIGDSDSNDVDLHSLKSIRFESHLQGESDVDAVLKIVELSPNLEYLAYRYYYNQLYGTFLESVAKTCSKLKGIHLDTEFRESGNYITDDELFTFLQNEPQLEYIYIEKCANINGSIYCKMGQFKQLKYFNVERGCYFYEEQIPAQCDEEPFKGDGVLPHLKYLDLGREMKGVNVDHLLKMAPNVKDVGYSLYNSTSNYLDIVDKLSNCLTVMPIIDLDEVDKVAFTQKWLEKTTVLESLTLGNILSRIDFSKLKPISSVKKLELMDPCHTDLLKELFRVFPCVEVYQNHSYTPNETQRDDTFIELIREGKWPQLRQVNELLLYEEQELTKLRPNLTCELIYASVALEEPIEKKWLLWDHIVTNKKRSDMERFFTNEL